MINGEMWYIQFVSPNHPRMYRSDGSHTIGCCDNLAKTIFINKNLDDILLKKVLCHEITHAAMFSYGIELTASQEELLADLIATYGNEILSITNKVFQKIKEGVFTPSIFLFKKQIVF